MPLSAAFDAWARDGAIIRLPVAANTRIFKGAMVQVNTSGFVLPMTAATGLKFVGIAEETVDNTGGTAGQRSISIFCQRNAVVAYPLRTGETWAATDYAAAAYADDDAVVSKTATGRTQIGVFFAPDTSRANHVYVRIVPAI